MLQMVEYLIGVPGPSGYGSKSTAEQVTELLPNLRHITAIITGATSGIGAETARVLAKRGARLVLPVRNLKAAEESISRIRMESPESEIRVMAMDLSSIESVRRFVQAFQSLNWPLHLLINNAGKFSYDHGISEDGVEITFATNYLGHFLLTKLLVKKMAETAEATGVQGRIVNVSSNMHRWFSGDMLHYLGIITKNKGEYDASRAYALSKLANVLHTKELARRLREMNANVTVNCVHPGIARTKITRDREGFLTDLAFLLASKLLKTIPQAAATTCYVATNPEMVNITGKYYSDCNEDSVSKIGSSLAEAARLWAASEIMTSKDGEDIDEVMEALVMYETSME